MNEALVNAPHAFAPSYDIGGAAEWAYRQFSIKGVIIGVGENDDGRAYNFFGLQVGYTLDTALGEGTYRVIYQGTSKDFLDKSGTKKERCECFFLSFDQQFGEIIGGWIRFGARDDAAAINYEYLYSGGINISGALWGREVDNFGIGYAYLEGGNQGIDYTQVAEAYLRFGLNDIFAVTLDGQYMEDNYDSGEGEDVDAWITGVRLVAEF
jgi:porin